MKIYFEDGKLLDVQNLQIVSDYIIDAADGVSANINLLSHLYENHRECVVYTNSIFAFNNLYAWNEELKLPEIYVRDSEQGLFTNISNLTNRQLRPGHNLAKMYISGEFSKNKWSTLY